MKRKLDKNKVYQRIGQAVVILGFHAMLSAMFIYGIMTATTLRQEG